MHRTVRGVIVVLAPGTIRTHLRNVKVTELRRRPDGTIETIDAYQE